MGKITVKDSRLVTPNAQRGGIHIERLSKVQCVQENFNPAEVWVRIVITDDKTEQEAIITETTARTLAKGLNALCDVKL